MFLRSETDDFSKRDNTIRINSYTTVRRRSAVPYEVYDNYWRDVHGPLCARLPGLGWYVQHHFAREHDGHLWPLPDGVSAFDDYVLDGMVEIGFASEGDQARFKKASSILFSDEQNIFDESVAYNLPHGSKTFLDRFEDPTPNGAIACDLLHLHFEAAHQDESSFHRFMTDYASALAKLPGVLKLRLHLPQPHDNTEPDPPAPDVEHSVPPARVLLAMLEIAFPNPLARREFLESAAFLERQTGQSKQIKRLTAFKVAGVYTYIRDGELTTAGLRGSRAAELIRTLGAINQVQPQVKQLMRTGEL